jgi:mRNA-degrading endonuclease RelE of RelBE toxin-antitoxin system
VNTFSRQRFIFLSSRRFFSSSDELVKRLAGLNIKAGGGLLAGFRLVYYPDEATRTITLCDFASRGSAYD